jgi:hypothetical protein
LSALWLSLEVGPHLFEQRSRIAGHISKFGISGYVCRFDGREERGEDIAGSRRIETLVETGGCTWCLNSDDDPRERALTSAAFPNPH